MAYRKSFFYVYISGVPVFCGNYSQSLLVWQAFRRFFKRFPDVNVPADVYMLKSFSPCLLEHISIEELRCYDDKHS